MNNKIIAAEQIKVGQWLTVLNWKPDDDHSYKGDILHVKAIDLPYVAVVECLAGKKSWIVVLDTRRVDFMELDQNYIKILT
jgi:uncharacterized protein involved in tellurium resistance